MTPEEFGLNQLRIRLGFIAVAIDGGKYPNPSDAADAILDAVLSHYEPHRQQLIDALTAAGLHVVPEGHAVIDGEVVRMVEDGCVETFCTPWCHHTDEGRDLGSGFKEFRVSCESNRTVYRKAPEGVLDAP